MALSVLLTPAAGQRLLADRARQARLALGLKQRTLAERSGVTLASLRRFERTGEVSLKHLLRIVHAIGRLGEFADLLPPPVATTMAELEARTADSPTRRRGSR